MSKKLTSAFALLVAGSLALSACSGPAKETTKSGESGGTNSSKSGGSVSVMWNQPLYSLNNNTSFGNATANANVVYMTNDSFNYYDKDLNLVKNESFGKYEKVSDDPLTIKLTLSDKAKWSDGTPVTAEDIILNHGAISGLYNTVKEEDSSKLKNEDGSVKKTDGSNVYFDSSSPSWALIKEFPVIGDNGKSLTYKYSKPFADWEKTLLGPGLPAHVIAARALGESDPTKGKKLVLDAFKNKDNAALTKIANSWNSDWNMVQMPADKDKNLLVGNGPMTITDYKKGQYIQLERNDKYEGDHKAQVDKVIVRYNEDPAAAVSALKNNEVQLISPQSNADILKSLQGLKGIKSETGTEGTYEHLDLTFNNGGPFDAKAYGGDKEKARKVRQAFLLTVPREEIVTKIIKPLLPDAAVRNSYVITPGAPGYDDVTAKNGMSKTYAKVDLDQAKKLLAEAGAGKPKVRIIYAKGNKRREAEFAMIKASAEQAGFQIIDNGSPEWSQKLGDKSYDVSFFGWQSTSTAVAESQANYITGGLNNKGGYSNPEVDKLYDQLLVETDEAKQQDLIGKIETLLVNDAFGVTLFQFPGISAWNEKLSGVSKMAISPTIFWNFWEWKMA